MKMVNLSHIRKFGFINPRFLNHDFRVPAGFFWKELLRDEGLTIGCLDSRYRGVDRSDAGDRYDQDPALTSWSHSFTPAINHYLREHLNYKTDLKYNIFRPVHWFVFLSAAFPTRVSDPGYEGCHSSCLPDFQPQMAQMGKNREVQQHR